MMSAPPVAGPRPTSLVEGASLAEALGFRGTLTLASELGQHTGSFKFRAAYRLVASIPQPTVITASSGNFGAALAFACRLLGKQAIVVMPTTSARMKIAAVRGHGAVVELVDTQRQTRAERVEELAAAHPEAYIASAYNDLHVIAGNASLGRELAAVAPPFDLVMAPVGGGGLTAGLVTGLREAGSATRVLGAEPALANDAARSLREGRIVSNAGEPATLADGARTVSLGRHNWDVLQQGLLGIVEVPEAAIAQAVRLIATHTGLRVEPTGALAVAALGVDPARFGSRRICCVLSGGNVDAEVYDAILAGAP